MEPLHARYPFLSASREAVEAAEVDLGAVAAERGPAVERGVARVRRALIEGTTAPESRWDARTELLSYPIARVLVSLLDVTGAVEKYASAEAALAYERFTDDFERDAELKSSSTPRLSLRQLLADFDLSGAATPTGDGRFEVDVTTYLELASDLDDGEWRLTVRSLDDGAVPVERRELYELLREAVRRRVAADLPLAVPDAVADQLDAEVRELADAVADTTLPRDLDTVAPDSFPPCVENLLETARDGETLAPHSRFALLSFLASVGMDEAEAVEFCGYEGAEAEAVRAQAERLIGDSGAQFAPPSCATMQAYGDCVDPDERCETIANPLNYYAAALEER